MEGERCRREPSPNPQRCKCCSAGGSGEPPKASRGEPVFWGTHIPYRARRPAGGVSVQPHVPRSPSAGGGELHTPPGATRSPSLGIWARTSQVKHGEDALTAGLSVLQISALNIYLITGSGGSGEREGMAPSIPMRDRVPPPYPCCQLALPTAEMGNRNETQRRRFFPSSGLQRFSSRQRRAAVFPFHFFFKHSLK